MEAKLSPKASFTWHSILSARELLAKDVYKVVGEGSTIDVCKDPWVPGFKVLLRANNVEYNLGSVSELMNGRQWNQDTLKMHFSQWAMDYIQCIPLPLYLSVDQWAWFHTKDGNFTVRSAYHVELKEIVAQQASNSGEKKMRLWRNLWGGMACQKF